MMFFPSKHNTITMYSYLGYVVITIKILKPVNISFILNSISYLI
jgi:hypothetical protein